CGGRRFLPRAIAQLPCRRFVLVRRFLEQHDVVLRLQPGGEVAPRGDVEELAKTSGDRARRILREVALPTGELGLIVARLFCPVCLDRVEPGLALRGLLLW